MNNNYESLKVDPHVNSYLFKSIKNNINCRLMKAIPSKILYKDI